MSLALKQQQWTSRRDLSPRPRLLEPGVHESPCWRGCVRHQFTEISWDPPDLIYFTSISVSPTHTEVVNLQNSRLTRGLRHFGRGFTQRKSTTWKTSSGFQAFSIQFSPGRGVFLMYIEWAPVRRFFVSFGPIHWCARQWIRQKTSEVLLDHGKYLGESWQTLGKALTGALNSTSAACGFWKRPIFHAEPRTWLLCIDLQSNYRSPKIQEYLREPSETNNSPKQQKLHVRPGKHCTRN